MSDWFDPFEDDEEPELDDAEEGATRLLVRLGRLAASLPWFERLGAPLSDRDREFGLAYCNGLGFPDADLNRLTNWDEAADAAANADWDTDAWEAAEQLRAALTTEACERYGEDFVQNGVQDVTGYAAGHIQQALKQVTSHWAIDDEELVNAAAGSAIRSLHNAALVLLGAEDENHALSYEYRLFELGRWPVTLTGRSYHIF